MKRRLFLGLCFCGLLLSAPLSPAQSSLDPASLPLFDESRTYSVSGVVLNEWLMHSKTQDAALKTADEKLAKLEAELKEALQKLEKSDVYFRTASELVKESQRLFDEYRLRTEVELWMGRIAAGAFAVAYALK